MLANPHIDHDASYRNVFYWLDTEKMTVWWIHDVHGKPDYVTCIREWPTDHGLVDGPVDRDCGKAKSACAAQARKMVGIKF